MCENPESRTVLRRLEESVLMQYHEGEGLLQVDDRNAYFSGKAIPKELWRTQSLEIGLPADLYLEVVAKAKDHPGIQVVQFSDQHFLVEIGGTVQSKYGPHRRLRSVMPYQ